MKKLPFILILVNILLACSSNTNQQASTSRHSEENKPTNLYDPNVGEGKFKDLHITAPLDTEMAAEGKIVADLKCASCHRYTEERLVGPGWKGITQRKQEAWIMNFITNPDPMIDKDPELQKQLEICLIRMPNQNLSEEEARNILEFMRENDTPNK